ncbi:Uncharacterised protein [Mycoplasmopsis citelli]|uniref:Lipoprotein n=1 Tax=Mycoplasmopsis citelli TaxID=171281 RepID=A0A449B1Q3_9BACT|nr:hypothetical protein [Mycoplasmopsis citelli]VEU74475.1 Uncharacterised protein [Mycoplasmopsis citelli]
MKIFRNVLKAMKKKNTLKFLLSLLTISLASTSAISCLYEDHPIVIYAKSYSQKNPFLVKFKQRVATNYQNNSLLSFENSLYNKANLNLNFKDVIYKIDGTYSVNNNEAKKTLKGLVTIENNKFNANSNLEQKITNENALKFFQEQWKLLQKKTEEYQSLSNNKNLSLLVSANFNNDSKKQEFTQLEEEIHDLYNRLNNLSFIDKSNPKKFIDKEKVIKVISHFLKDTPLYAEFLKKISLPENDSNSLITVTRDNFGDVNTIIFQYNKSQVPFNSIPYSHFINVAKQVKDRLTSSQIEDTKNVYLKLFNYMKNQKFVVSDELKAPGMALGFGPEFLLTSQNPEDNQKSDLFKVFSETSEIDKNLKLRKDFLDNPKEFFENNLDLVNFESVTNADLKVESLEKNDDTSSKNYILAKQKQSLIHQRLNNFKTVFNELKTLREQNASQQTIISKQEELSKLEASFKDDIENSRKKLNKGISIARTNINHLVELYGYFLFIIGVYDVQLIKGTHQYPNEDKERETYWLEFFDKKTNKWYMVDIYKGYLSYSSENKFTYNPTEELYTSLPKGYTVDPNFVDAAHVK